MNKENINLAILFIIVVMVCVLIKRYNNLNINEHFEGDNTTTLPPADSTYNLQQYIETNPPTGSKVIKREISHTLPDVIDKDIVMRDDAQIRFGSMRGEAGSDSDNFHFAGISHASEPHLKMVLGDSQDKNSSFQIHGGACTANSNCNMDGTKLHQFDSTPEYKMFNKSGTNVFSADKDGNVWCKGNLSSQGHTKVKNIEIENSFHAKANSTFDAKVKVKGGMNIEGGTDLRDTVIHKGLTVIGNTHTTGPNNIMNGVLEVKNDIHGRRNSKIAGILHANEINGQNMNVRSRLYFSDAGKDGRSWDEKIYSDGNFSDAHQTDVMYLEKQTRNTAQTGKDEGNDGRRSTLVMQIGDDPSDAFEIWSGDKRVFRIDGNGDIQQSGVLRTNVKKMFNNKEKGGRYW